MKINTLQEAKQAAFNGAYKGLNHQKWKQSISEYGDSCAYTGQKGTHCGVGWLIPKEKYDEYCDAIEDVAVNCIPKATLIAVLADPLSDWCKQAPDVEHGEFVEFLRQIQTSHDRADSPSCMKSNLHDMAEDHKLTIPKV